MISLVIITHGDFGAYLIEAAEMIVGAQPEGVDLVSISARVPVDAARAKLAAIMEKRKNDGIVIFTDMLGGTPTNIAFPMAQKTPNSVVISGVNLNMVLAAFSYRGRMSLEELAHKVVEDGKKSVCDVKALFNAARPK
jgi:PTS system mannose-specific IIA component